LAAFLFTLYFIAGCYLVFRSSFIKNAGLGANTIFILFCLKIAAGLAVGLVNHYLMHGQTDYDSLNMLGIQEHKILLHDPGAFFSDLFTSNYADSGEFFGSTHSYWNDLRTNIIIKTLAVLDTITLSNYYVNSLFFNFFCFFGHVALYKIYIHIFPGKKLQAIIGCFLLPSTLYFTSGVHKDLIVFTALAFFCYYLYFGFFRSGNSIPERVKSDFSMKKILLLIISFGAVLFIRNFVAVMILPFAAAFFICMRYRLKPAVVFGALTLLIIGGIIFVHYSMPAHDPLQMVVAKQQAFFSLGTGSTQYQNDTLQSTLSSFAHAAPTALRHSFLSPFPGEFNNAYLHFFSVEIFIYFLFFTYMLLLFQRNYTDDGKAFLYFTICFSVAIFLFAGYITTTAGALMRYRSIYLPFFITPLLCSINYKKLKRHLKL
jgi:hypothetical protein